MWALALKLSLSPPDCVWELGRQKRLSHGLLQKCCSAQLGGSNETAKAAKTSSLQASLLYPALSQSVQLQSSYDSHWNGQRPSWCRAESGDSSCNICPHVFETCCLPSWDLGWLPAACHTCLVGCHRCPRPPPRLQVCKHEARITAQGILLV